MGDGMNGSETWFRKVGRKYVPIVEAEKYDYITMPAEGFTLAHRKGGATQWEYAVKPDNAGFLAAAMVARTAMEEAIRQAATYRPSGPIPYTKKQLAIIEKFKVDMGIYKPLWWEQTSARDIVQAGIDAVRGGK
jgi:pyruvate kinase